MGPLLTLAEAASGSFDATAALDMGKTVMTWILSIIKGEPILAAMFVIGVLVPAGFGIVRGIKAVSH